MFFSGKRCAASRPQPGNSWFILNRLFCWDIIGLGLKPLLVKAEEGKRGFSAWFQSCRSFFSPLQQLQRLGSPSPRLMAAVCLSRAEEEQQQMWDLSADPHGDVSEDQSCFCSISALVTLVFLDFPPAENEGLWRICFSSSSWWTNPLRASVV